METPKPQEIYRHFKGNLYQIITLAQHSETSEILVIYQALYGDFKVYARPLTMFMSPVDKEKYPDIRQEMRFEKVSATLAGTAQPEKGDASAIVIDPLLDEFLEAKNCERKLELLEALRGRLDDDILTAMAISCDIALDEGTIEERYRSLKNALLMRDKYECNRLR